MDFVFLRLFPIGLLLGGLALAISELRHHAQERPGVPLTRLLRRVGGALLLMILAVLVMLGRIPHHETMSTGEVWTLFRHWLWVMGIALVLTGLALWDALDGVRHLRGYFEDVEKEEIQRIQQHLTAPRESERRDHC